MKHLNKLFFLVIFFLPFKGYSQCSISATNITNVNCNGLCDGSALAVATGTAPFTYSINNGGTINPTSGSASGLCAGTYIITATDASSCSTTTSIVITQPSPITVFSSLINNVNCNGYCDGNAQILTTGGTGVYAINITGPGTPSINSSTGLASNLCAGTYTVSVADANLCSVTTTFSILQPAVLTSIVANTTNPSCVPGCDGSATINATGGISPYNFTINPPPTLNTTGIFQNLCVGYYTVVVTDANMCSSTTGLLLNGSMGTPFTITSTTLPSCMPGCDGTATFYSALAQVYTAIPSAGLTLSNNTISGFCTGTNYNIVATDANGCSYTSSLNFTNASLNMTLQNASICSNSFNTCIQVTNGTPPYSYTINPLVSFTPPCLTNLALNTTYTITVVDANGCSATSTISSNSIPFNGTLTYNNITCGTNNGQICVNGSSGNSPFQYSVDNGLTYQSSNCFTGLSAGSYSVVVKDANGCTNSSIATLQNLQYLSLFSSNSQSCTSLGDCQLISSGTNFIPPVTYSIGTTNNTTGYFSGLTSGVYTVTSTDANGCTNTKTVTIGFTNSGNFAIVTSIGPGSIVATAPTQTGPILYSLNGAPLSSTNTFNGLCSGGYTIQVQDANGCIATTYATVTSDTTFPGAVMNTIITDAICANTNDGSVDFIFTPASTHYFCPFGWSNCGITTSLHDQLSPATYGLDIIDSATNYCVTKLWTINSIGTNCGNISGKVYLDSNSNCINDINEYNLNNIPIKLSSGQYTFTNPLGNYSFNGVAYNSYTVSQLNNYWTNYVNTNSCGNNFNLTLNSTTPNIVQNFADTSTSVLNNSIVVSSGFFVPGIASSLNVIHYGTSPLISSNGIITLVLDSNLTYQNANPTPNYISPSGDTLKWNYSSFTTYASYQVNFITNTSATISTSINNCAYDDVTSGLDAYLPNNTSCSYSVVVASFDPNNKVVSPAGTQPIGGILKQDSVLSYTINFQNTGTYLAHKVVVMDTLSDKVDLTKFRVIGYSHPYEIQVIDNHILKFIFDQIMLPDSNSNEPASHGHISYQIMQKNTNQLGDVIKNKAYIYFDYNAPVITNETVNTIVAPTAISNSIKSKTELSIYPNPAQNEVVLTCNEILEDVTIVDIQSRIVFSKNNIHKNVVSLNIQSLKNGIYFIKTSNGMVQRLIVNK